MSPSGHERITTVGSESDVSAQHRPRRAERQPCSGIRWETQETALGEVSRGTGMEAVARVEAMV